jgi:hypothetical protein
MYRVNIKKDMLAYAGQDVYKFVFGKVKGKYKLVALISENQFAEFFANFQAAIKQDNYEVISGMMDFPVEGMMDAEGNPISDAKSFKSNKMLEGFKGCFNITYLGTNVDYKPVVKKSSKSNETTSYYFSDTDYEEGYNGATDVVSFTVNIHESSVGEEDFYDFSISHIFGKKNGRYKLIAIMVAG